MPREYSRAGGDRLAERAAASGSEERTVEQLSGGGDNLASYARVDLNTSYDVTDNVQVYGLVKNLFDSKYGLYGTYFEANEVSEVDKALGGAGFTDPRTISPSMPFAAYGGVKVKY